MKTYIDRRRFLGSAACTFGMSIMLQGCGGGGGSTGGGSIIAPPAPAPPVPAPAPPPPNARPLRIAFAGSSSAAQYLSLYRGPADNPAVTASSDGISFAPLTIGAFGKTAGTFISNALARPVMFLRGGVGATTLAQWSAGNSPQRTALVQAIRAAGGVDAILVQVGRNDAANLTVPSTDAQVAQLRALIASLRSEARVPDATIFIGASQDMLDGNTEQHLQLGRQRLAEITVANADSNIRYGFSTYDLETVDGIHQSESAQGISGTRFAAQVIAWARGTAQQRGPQIASVAFVSQTETRVSLRHGAGTDILPEIGVDGFQLVLGGGATELAITAAERVDPTTVRLTHAARNNRPVRVAYALDHDVSDTRCLRDNSTYGLPAEPYVSELM